MDIVTRLLEKTEADRLGAEDSPEVQRHPWFAGVDFDAMLRKEIPRLFAADEPTLFRKLRRIATGSPRSCCWVSACINGDGF